MQQSTPLPVIMACPRLLQARPCCSAFDKPSWYLICIWAQQRYWVRRLRESFLMEGQDVYGFAPESAIFCRHDEPL